MGGMESASAAGRLPQDEHQITNIRHSQKRLSSSTSGADDVCADATGQFVRDVKAAPDPAVVLATDSQLHDLAKFSTQKNSALSLLIQPLILEISR